MNNLMKASLSSLNKQDKEQLKIPNKIRVAQGSHSPNVK